MKTIHKPHSIILDPENDSAPMVVLYGGLMGWEYDWLIPRIPLDLKQNVTFVLPAHYLVDCSLCLKEAHSEVSKDRVSSYSLCGFSRGGINVYKYLKLADWKILGLIDPSAPRMGGYADSVLDSNKGKIRCAYWLQNWAKADYYPKIVSFHKHLSDINAEMVDDIKTPHAQMPNFFFETYRSDFK